MLVDSHCHLDFPEFAPELDAVVDRAERAGVGAMLTISTHLSRFDQVLAIAERFDSVYCTVGVHPHEAAREGTMTVEALTRLARHPKVVGFGETGLDRESLYKALSTDGNPEFGSVQKDVRSLGLKLHISA